ncbi:MAG: restriction endonuclease subunit S [Methylococcales bacterium]|nr:restriction endonuclease subunit S [Methylococcales bacterium]
MTRFKTARISEFCTTGSGGTPSRNRFERYYQGGTIPWVKSGELRESVINRTSEYVTEAALKESSIKLVPAGAILLAMYGATVGRLGILGIEATTNQAVCHIIPDPKVAETQYVFHAISHRVPSLISMGVGGAQPNINQTIIKDLVISLPPLPEQRRIAAILDQADALRAKRREALAQLDSLTQSIFIEMFGDPIGNSIKWQQLLLSEAVIGKYGIKAGPFGSSLKKEEYTSSGYRIYGQEQVIAGRFDIGDYYISAAKFEQLSSCAVAENDLLLSLVGSFGKVLIVPPGIEPGIINPRLLKITPNQDLLTSEFLAALLQQPTIQAEFERVAHGGTMGILNAGLLKTLNVIIPPLDLQRKFTRQLDATKRLSLSFGASLTELDALFASLQHRAFRGEL